MYAFASVPLVINLSILQGELIGSGCEVPLRVDIIGNDLFAHLHLKTE